MATIVVTEDNQSVSAVLEDYLSLAGHEIICFAKAEEALQFLLTSHCAVLIVDALLPGMTGLELYRRVRDLLPGLRVIFAYGDDRFELQVNDIVAADPCTLAVRKPYSMNWIERAVAAA